MHWWEGSRDGRRAVIKTVNREVTLEGLASDRSRRKSQRGEVAGQPPADPRPGDQSCAGCSPTSPSPEGSRKGPWLRGGEGKLRAENYVSSITVLNL